MAIKILAAADLHLGKRSSGISMDVEECATKFAWQQIVDWAITNKIDIILLCGDIVDRNNRYYEAIGPLQTGFEKLGHHGISIYMVAGNHDYDVLPQIVDAGQYTHVHLLGRNGQWEMKTVIKNGQTVQLAGWSFPRQFMQQDAFINFNTLRPDPNYPSIGILHADLDNPESHYNPVRGNDLASTSIRTWLLGHIHKPMIADISGTSICYPGSPQALSSKEPGIHGFLEVGIEDDYNIKIKPIGISTVRYEKLTVDISNTTTEEEVRTLLHLTLTKDANSKLTELEKVLYLIYDIYLTGEHSNEMLVLQWAEQIKKDYEMQLTSGSKISVRYVTSSIEPLINNLEELSKQPTPAGMLASVILAIRDGQSTPLLNDLVVEWKKTFRDLQTSSVYQPLQPKWQIEIPPANANDFILRESNRLLSRLLLQTNKL
jgi:DNA repair exonuclease SbcCD nuclease subunit